MEYLYPRSYHEYTNACKYIPGGVESSTLLGSPGEYPIYIERGNGQYVWDIDGNKYLDFLCGFGSVIIGHDVHEIDQTVLAQIKNGQLFGLSSSIQNTLAELIISSVPCAQLVRFMTNTSEACLAAVQTAKMYTGRRKILSSGYHGWLLPQKHSTGTSGLLKYEYTDVIDFSYNSIKIEALFKKYKDEIACVFIEPDPRLHDRNLLIKIKKLCVENDSILIFDEAKTGFRISLGGAQEYYSVFPDIVVLGKAMSNGYPIACIAGNKEYMQAINSIWTAGTYHYEVSSILASIKTIKLLKNKNTQNSLDEVGHEWFDRMSLWINKTKYPAEMKGIHRMPYLKFKNGYGTVFYHELLQRGFLLHVDRWYYTVAHTSENILELINAMKDSMTEELKLDAYEKVYTKLLFEKYFSFTFFPRFEIIYSMLHIYDEEGTLKHKASKELYPYFTQLDGKNNLDTIFCNIKLDSKYNRRNIMILLLSTIQDMVKENHLIMLNYPYVDGT